MITYHPTVFGTQQRQNNRYGVITLLNSGNIPVKQVLYSFTDEKTKAERFCSWPTASTR